MAQLFLNFSTGETSLLCHLQKKRRIRKLTVRHVRTAYGWVRLKEVNGGTQTHAGFPIRDHFCMHGKSVKVACLCTIQTHTHKGSSDAQNQPVEQKLGRMASELRNDSQGEPSDDHRHCRHQTAAEVHIENIVQNCVNHCPVHVRFVDFQSPGGHRGRRRTWPWRGLHREACSASPTRCRFLKPLKCPSWRFGQFADRWEKIVLLQLRALCPESRRPISTLELSLSQSPSWIADMKVLQQCYKWTPEGSFEIRCHNSVALASVSWIRFERVHWSSRDELWSSREAQRSIGAQAWEKRKMFSDYRRNSHGRNEVGYAKTPGNLNCDPGTPTNFRPVFIPVDDNVGPADGGAGGSPSQRCRDRETGKKGTQLSGTKNTRDELALRSIIAERFVWTKDKCVYLSIRRSTTQETNCYRAQNEELTSCQLNAHENSLKTGSVGRFKICFGP